MYYILLSQYSADEMKKKWTSPIYSFFSDIKIGQEDDGRRYHFFKCAAVKCKVKRTYENADGTRASDAGSTGNLKKHALLCFGENVVEAAIKGEGVKNPDGSIFAAFARAGQRPVNVSHRAHTNPEARANIVRWVTESTRAPHLVNDRGFRELMLAGRPNLDLPNGRRVSRDIQASFNKCKETTDKLLQDYPGMLSYATDAWTSPNHRAFVAWTVHLQHEGTPLCFLLDIIEVPEVWIY
ncbi:hypothetical protein DFH08DRAFT_724124 [Mycena albidolilacea]|uniref:Uncharacterized protein n=1 Tax=Mycena albidolilacea TaxID=1033008 RepID=A0AAD6YYY3_9AGAR|nr:hypothetical protein DFH08DRAFT_724124 [Mycena albidolilacea]